LPRIIVATRVDHQSSVLTGDSDAKSGAIMGHQKPGGPYILKAELNRLRRKMKELKKALGEYYA